MVRWLLPGLFLGALAVSPITSAEGADPVWPPHAVVGLNSVRLEPSATCRGDVAVVYATAGPFLGPAHEVTLEAASRVEGSVTARGVELTGPAVVDGEIRADVVTGGPKRRPTPVLRFPLPLDLPAFPRFMPGDQRLDVAAGTRSIRPGSYGVLSVAGTSAAEAAAIVLEPGIYDFEEIGLGPRARLECAGGCEIRVENRLFSGEGSYLGPAPRAGLSAADVEVFVGGVNGTTGTLREEPPAAAFGDGSVLEARVYAPNGTVRLGPRARAAGRLVGRDVLLGRGATVAADSRTVGEEERVVERGPLLFRETSEVQTVGGQVRALSLVPGVVVAAHEFFARYGESLGLGPDDTVVELSAVTDHRGHVHHRFQQRHRGVPVFGVGYIVEEVESRVVGATGRIVVGLDIQPTPALTEAQALARGLMALPPRIYAWEQPATGGRVAQRPRGRLGIGSVSYAMTPGSFRLVYRFNVSSVRPPASETLDVDAHTGETVGRFGNIRRQTVTSQGDTLFYGKKGFLAEKFGTAVSQYRLEVPSGGGLPGLSTVLRVSDTGDADLVDFVRDQNDFSYWPAPDRTTAESKLPDLIYGVSVHWAIQRAVEYLKPFELSGWWSSIRAALAEYKELMPGGDDSTPRYDPNDDTIYVPRTGEGAKLVTLAVIGHEFTHGLLHHAVPENVYSGESGAVEEGLADAFGILLSAKEDDTSWCGPDIPLHKIYYKDPGGDGSCGDGTTPCPGEQCDDPVAGVCSQALPPDCSTRNFAEPKATGNPDTYLGTNYVAVAVSADCAQGDQCHQNSTIVSHWLYILVNGKTGTNYDLKPERGYSVKGIGFAKAGTIVTGTILLKLWGATSFADLRTATVNVASEQFGPKSPEVISVANAWYAVGVGDAYDPREYTPASVGGVEPWPAVLTWSALPSEYDWQAQVSTSPKFDTDVRTVSADASLVVPGAPGNVKITAHVNLKPAAKYYWRVRAKAMAPPPSSGSFAPTGAIIPTTPSSGRKLAPPSGTAAPALTGSPVMPVPPDALWGAWGNTQEFVTAAKTPVLHAPAPKGSKPTGPAPVKFQSATAGGLEPPAPAPPATPPVAEGAYYPWKTEFSWGAVPGATSYRLTVSTSTAHECDQTYLALPGSHTEVETVPATKLPTHQVGLRSGRTYYWWLKVFGPEGIPGGCSYAGSPVKFSTSAPTTTLVSPPDGGKVPPLAVPLSWKATAGAAGYQVEVSPSGSTAYAVKAEPPSTSATISVDKTGPFQWRVRPKGPLGGDFGAYTPPWTFIADKSLAKPELEYPLEGDYPTYGSTINFLWKPVAGVAKYDLTIYHRNADGSVGAVASVTPGGAAYPGTNDFYLEPPGAYTEVDGYCWRVAASGLGGLVTDSDVHCFRLGAAQPTLQYPPDGSAGVEYQPTTHFAWSSPYSPGGFRFGWGACPAVNDLSQLTVPAGQTTVDVPGLSPSTPYCWKVVGIDPDGSEASTWSTASFSTKAAPPPSATCKPLATGSIAVTWPAATAMVGNPVTVSWAVEDNDPPIAEYRIHVFVAFTGGGLSEYAVTPTYPATASGEMAVTLPYWLPANVSGTAYAVLVDGRTSSSCQWYPVGGSVDFFVSG